MPTTYFYRTPMPLSAAHRAEFEACHQEQFPGNLLSVVENVAGTECLVKCCGNMEMPAGFTLLETLSLEQARTLLQTPAWKRPSPI